MTTPRFFLGLLACLLTTPWAWAQTTTADGLVYTSTAGAITITGYTGAGGAITIPAAISGVPVTAIGASAFGAKTTITGVSIPSSVTSIGTKAFYQCASLSSITVDVSNPAYASDGKVLFNKTQTTLIQAAPAGVSGNYTIPSSVTSIGTYALYYCAALTGVTIPSSVTSIGGSGFYECTSLAAITVNASNPAYTSDGKVLFNKAQTTLIQAAPAGVSGSYTIPSSVTSIGSYAFLKCKALTGVTIPFSVTSIGSGAFLSCTALTGVTIPSSVTSIGTQAFNGCTALASITVDASNPAYASDGKVLFNKTQTTLIHAAPKSVLGSYTIPSSVTSIESNAFQSCTALTGVTISFGVTSIGSQAFYNCTALASITVDASNPAYASDGKVLFNKTQTTLIQAAPAGVSGGYTIPSSVTSIGTYAFQSCTALTGVTIPASVTSIGTYAFWNCAALTGITIPSSVTSIGGLAFYNCTALATIAFMGNAPTDVSNAFVGTALTKVYYLPTATGWGATFSGITTQAVASTGTTADGFAYSLIGSSYSITGYSGTGGAITIPATIGGVPVTRIGNAAFQRKATITGVSFPASVTTIEAYAFDGCSNLASLTLPGALQSLGASAFSFCSALTSATIPASVTAMGTAPFIGCTSLTTLTVAAGNPNYASSSGGGFILSKDGLATVQCAPGLAGSVTIPGSVTSIGGSTFDNCQKLSEIILPAGLKIIGGNAFAACLAMKSISLPEGLTTIGDFAFVNCTTLANVTLPSTLTALGVSAFQYCHSLGPIVIPGGVTEIKPWTFYLAGLTSISLPSSITTIGAHAFQTCGALKGIAFPANVTSIGDGAFDACTQLATIVFYGAPPTPGIGLFAGTAVTKALYVQGAIGWGSTFAGLTTAAIEVTGITPAGLAYSLIGTSYTLTGYTGAGGAITIPAAISGVPVTAIGASAFGAKTTITGVIIPSSVTSIGTKAFNQCASLSSITVDVSNPAYASDGKVLFNKTQTTLIQAAPAGVPGSYTIPSSVTSIGTSAFQSCTALTAVTIPSSVTSIGSQAFYQCASLASITVDASNPAYTSDGKVLLNKTQTTLIQAAPKGVSGSYTIPSSVTSIGIYAFSNCKALTGVTIPSSVTSIGSDAFRGCIALTGVTIPSSVTSIGSLAFSHCTALTGVTIPSGVTSIGSQAFYNCTKLASITVDASNPAYTSDGKVLFNKTQTTLIQAAPASVSGSYTIPSSVTSIGIDAFLGCSALTSVTIPSSVNSIGSYAFGFCTALTGVTIPSSVTSIGSSAFRGCTALTGVTIPSSVTSIGVLTFYDCTKLAAITVDASNPAYASDGKVLFNKTRTLLIQAVPAGVSGSYTLPSSVTSIESYAFYNCTALTGVTIPSSVTSIGTSAFSSCTALATIAFVGNAPTQGSDTFAGTALTKVYYLPTATGWGATFAGIPTQAVASTGTTADGFAYSLVGSSYTITGYTGTGGAITIPAAISGVPVTAIGNSAFLGKTSVTGVNIPSSVTIIGSSAFDGCVALANVNIPAGVTSIGNSAFKSCRGLANVAIPASVTSIGDLALFNCTGLASITVDSANSVYFSDDKVLFNKAKTTLVQATPVGVSGSYLIPSTVTLIASGAFGYCAALVDVIVPAGVTSIANNAFEGCVSLTGFTMPAGVVNIGNSAFNGCSKLVSVTIPSSVTSIGSYAFQSCTALTSVSIPANVTSVGTAAFRGCSNLELVVFFGNAPTEGGLVFHETKVAKVYYFSGKTGWSGTFSGIPTSVVSAPLITTPPAKTEAAVGQAVTLSVTATGGGLGYQWTKDGSAISGATSASYVISSARLTDGGMYDVVVSNTLGTATAGNRLVVGQAASDGYVYDDNAGQLTLVGYQGPGGAITIPASIGGKPVVSLGRDLFAYRSTLSSVVIPEGVKTLVQGVFFSCPNLTSVVVPSTVSSVGAYVFQQCPQLASIVVAAGNPAFSSEGGILYNKAKTMLLQCSRAVTGALDLPATVTSIGRHAFFGCTFSRLSFPAAITTIDSGGFYALGGLVSVYFRGNAPALSTPGPFDSFGSVTVYYQAGTQGWGSTFGTRPTAVYNFPVITDQPVGATLNTGDIANFRVTGSGSAPLTYQWRKDGSPIAGATGSVYALGAVTTGSAGSFDVVVTNTAGTVTSPAAVLTINLPVVFNAQPASVTTFVGSAVTFSAPATAYPGVPTYQWRKNGVALSGATISAFTLASVQLADVGSYDVVVTATAGSATSNAATLAVSDSAPLITAQSAAATLAVGGNTTLGVSVGGSRPLTYQWRRDGVPILGATSASFALANAQTFDGGLYTVVVTNAIGSVTSAAARLSVIPRVVAYSARLQIDPEGAVAVFTIEGTVPKKVLLRAVGPGLASFGFSGLPDPQLELFNSAGTLLAINNEWSSSVDAAAITATTAAVGAFALTIGSRDSAVLATLAPGTYTVRAKPASGAGGTGYLELYDADLATGPMSTLPYVAVRGRMGAGGGVVIGGLGSNGRGQRSYLVRAIGATLGLPGAHANPAMLILRDGTLVGSNDDWDSNPADAAATTAASARVATFPLAAGARDAALVLTGNIHAGACTVQVGGSDALGGTVLLELHDLDAARPAAFAPAIVSSPVTTNAIAGEAVSLRVLAQGTAPLSYQWRKGGIPLDGATAATLALASVQAGQGGSYSVLVSSPLGAATSLSAVLSVQSGGASSAATQAVVGGGYEAGGTVTVTNTLTFAAGATGLGWKATLPLGWSLVSDAGTLGDVRPVVGTVGALEWAWTTPPTSPLTFSYTVRIPPGVAGDQFIASSGIVRVAGSVAQPIATPSPLSVPQITGHTADTNADFRISLFELTRVIELYNTRNGTVRTGRYAVATTATEDGFAPDPVTAPTATVTLTRYHSADTASTAARDAKINLIELTRVIELYNVRSGTVRTGAYRVLAGTEDGYAPGL